MQIIDSLAIGGAEKLIVETVPLLVAKGNQVDVVLLNGEKTHLYKELEALNCCTIFTLGTSYYNPIYILKLIPFFYKYDVVHVHLFPAQYFAAIARLFCFKKVKLFFTEHNTSNRRLENKKFRLIEKLIYACYDNVICITEEVKSVLKEKLNLSNNKLLVIENGVNLNNVNTSIKYNRELFNYSVNDKILIMVAGFREQKDQDSVIKALKLLPEDYKLLLIGDGARRPILEDLVETLQLQDRVTFLGIRNDVYALMKMCDIAILSSHWEGFGLVAVEAMASGIPLIASDVNGLAQVVDGGGLLFEPSNVEDLISKILKLNDPFLYQQTINNCLEKSKKYDINLMVDELINLYDEN
ncbi:MULTISPECIES: glycosyltransferase family 4 protein [unclassified Empedobacter]|uniref:glycosyltransferase family 4 protein n=1 Tax=unclassified Empedobacter TaxID=2643773 RepID=UPI00244813F4|nr:MULTISPECIES: glycosyltransferase family 4 protein [unclassified Empedobacter]MDH2207305.1 glycosyltransferase family 4 protein [Empedobacter sp. GD03644]